MNASGQFVSAGPTRTLFGLPLSELGWTEALTRIETLVDFRSARPHGNPAGRLTIGFDTGSHRLRQWLDRGDRMADDSRVVLPAAGNFSRLLRRLAGLRASAGFAPDRFALSLLTFLERKRRVGLVGQDSGSVGALKAQLGRHAPWHDYVEIEASGMVADDFDLVIVDLPRREDERKIEQKLAAAATGLVVMTGGSLSRTGRPD